MNGVNKTLYIPLYGKAQVSQKGIILADQKAEEIWKKEQFPLKGKAKSKWLAYNMAMRARVFDDWTKRQLKEAPNALVLHIGCGMDSRVLRVGTAAGAWYDIDFSEVIEERRKYYSENDQYHMLCGDASKPAWVESLPEAEELIVILEGVSMYLTNDEVRELFLVLQRKYKHIHLLMDVYTTFGAKASKYKNPINTVGVTQLYGMEGPETLMINPEIQFAGEGTMTPQYLVDELKGFEKAFFTWMFTGSVTKKIYRLFEYFITQA
ncbi:MAG: class I SAM-dependent methyltransferase [bacterium]|nr:class I SAM-dependent methyltransferase [bacterium]